jgi:large subunit ribosomal protein L20
MARVKGSVATRAHRKKILNLAEGYFGSKHLLFKTAKEQVLHSLRYSYVSRREIKRDFRKLWIKRINAACHANGISYSRFIDGLAKNGIAINRKMLSEMAINDPTAFASLVATAKKVPAKKAETK